MSASRGTRLVSTIDYIGIDMDDIDAVEKLWNDWNHGLFLLGFRPSEEPIRIEGDALTYELTEIGGALDQAGLVISLAAAGARLALPAGV